MKTAPVEITCKMGLQKDNFLAYKLSGCFSTAIFLDMDISGHSLLVKQIVVPWKFQENGLWKAITAIPVHWYRRPGEMRTEDVLSKFTMYKFIAIICFALG